MRKSYIDKFERLDLSTPEGLELLRECAALAVELRKPPAGSHPNICIRIDENGMFHREDIPNLQGVYALVAVPKMEDAKDPRVSEFVKRFAVLYLKDKNPANNKIHYIRADKLEEAERYRAVIWIGRDNLPLDWRLISDDFTLDGEGRPVYIINEGTLDACVGLDMDSPQVKARMEHIAKQGLGHVEARQEA